MFSKIVISVTSRQAIVGLWRLGRLASCTAFSSDEAGHDDFRLFLHHHPNVPIHLIADVVEEDFRLETLPHTSGGARQEMLERKLNQLYRNTSYRTAQFIGREKDRRRDDRFLFISLTNPDIIAPWLVAMENLQAPLAGVYLLPSVSQLLIKALKLKTPDLLLITHQRAGLRQTYFANQQLRLSRLTSLTGMDERQVDRLYISETEKTRLYLISLRLIARETRLQVVFPTAEPINSNITSQLEESQGVSCNIIGPAELARSIGLNAELLKQYPDLLHMHVLAGHSATGNLAPAPQTKNFQLHRLRNGINAVSALCVACAAIFGITNLLNTADTWRKLQEVTNQTMHQESLYDEVARNFPKTPLPGSDLKTAVSIAKKISEINRTPQRMMQVISEALNTQREIQLNHIHWKLGDNPNSTEVEGKDASSTRTGNVALPASPTGLYEIGFIDGEISNFNGDYPAALDSVNRLVEALKQNKEVEQVIVLQQPVNTSSLVNLQGSTFDQDTRQSAAAVFKIKVILKTGATT